MIHLLVNVIFALTKPEDVVGARAIFLNFLALYQGLIFIFQLSLLKQLF